MEANNNNYFIIRLFIKKRYDTDISIQFAPRCTSVLVYTNNEGSIKARVPSGFPARRATRRKPTRRSRHSRTKEGSFESTSTIINPSGENRDVSTFGARIVHDTDDLLARKIRAEYEKQSSVVFSLTTRVEEVLPRNSYRSSKRPG